MPIRVELDNFGCWEHKIIELDDNGIVLLSADSGSGKSTIMRAIHFALYGSNKKVARFGTTKCRVKLYINDMEIIRQKGPNRLQVTFNDTTYEDKEAQAFINTKFPDDSFYISQDGGNTFIAMTAPQKLEYLEKSVLAHIPLDNYLEDIQQQIKTLDTSVIQYETKLAISKTTIDTLGSKLDQITISDIPYELKGTDINTLEQLLKDIEVANRLQYEYRMYEATKNQVKSELNTLLELQKPLIDIEVFASIIKSTEYKLDILRTNKLYHDIQLNQKETSEQLYEAKQQYEKASQKVTEYGYTLEGLEGYLSMWSNYKNIKKELDSIPIDTLTLHELQRQLKLLIADIYRCPCCDKKLVFNAEGILVLFEDQETIVVNETKTNIQKRIQNIDRREFLNNCLGKYDITSIPNESECKSLKQTLLTMMNDVTMNKERMVKLQNDYNKYTSQLQRYNTPNIEVKETTSELEQILYETKAQLNQSTQQNKEQTRLLHKINDLTFKLNELKAPQQPDTTLLTMNTDTIRDNIRLLRQYTSTLNMLLEINSSLTSERNQYTLIQKMLDKYKRDIENLKIFKTKLVESKALCVSNLIDTINVTLEGWLSAFFTDSPLTCTLESFKETKTGSKPEVHLTIDYKGNGMSFSNLSGGEQDRVVLAFSLALSEINNSPVILLDECLSSLDENTCSDVFEHLKTFSESRCIVLVAHQITSGMFDNVLTF